MTSRKLLPLFVITLQRPLEVHAARPEARKTVNVLSPCEHFIHGYLRVEWVFVNTGLLFGEVDKPGILLQDVAVSATHY